MPWNFQNGVLQMCDSNLNYGPIFQVIHTLYSLMQNYAQVDAIHNYSNVCIDAYLYSQDWSISWDFISKLLGQKILSHKMTWIYVQLVLPFLVPLPSPWFPFFFFFFPPSSLSLDPSLPPSVPEVLKGSLFPPKTSKTW